MFEIVKTKSAACSVSLPFVSTLLFSFLCERQAPDGASREPNDSECKTLLKPIHTYQHVLKPDVPA